MTDIAILGFGVVGGGITEVIEKNREQIRSRLGDDINVKYILDLRDFPDSPYGDRVVHDISVITGDPDVKIVCEAMGGSHPALEQRSQLRIHRVDLGTGLFQCVHGGHILFGRFLRGYLVSIP